MPAARPPRRTQAERREEAEQRLLEAALAIVARRGTARLTLAEVGLAAGYSRGLPAQRFGNKAGLLRALAAHIGERYAEQLNAAPRRKPGLDAIRGHIRVYFSRPDPDWTTTRALLMMLAEGLTAGSDMREDFAAYNRSALKFFEHHLSIGIANGEIANGADPGATAVLLLGALRGTMLQWLLDDSIELHRLSDRLLAIVDRAIPIHKGT